MRNSLSPIQTSFCKRREIVEYNIKLYVRSYFIKLVQILFNIFTYIYLLNNLTKKITFY